MEVRTLTDLYRHSMRNHPRDVAFRFRSGSGWTDISSQEFERRVEACASGLLVHGVQPGDRIALLSENRVEWALVDIACLEIGAVVVPIYPTLLAEQIEYLLNDSGSVAVFCSTPDQVEKIRSIREKAPSVREVISFEAATSPDTQSLDKLLELGRLNVEDKRPEIDRRADATGPEDTATIIYTSGTTGQPKGVVLTHGNITENVRGVARVIHLGPEDRCLSFLPLSHIFERMAGHYYMLYQGVSICYAESPETVANDMGEIRPTVMVSVPRLYEKIYSRVLEAANTGSPTKRKIFWWAKAVGERWATKMIRQQEIDFALSVQKRIADALVFRKLQGRTGGRLKFFVSGGAPLAREIAEFFFAAGLPIYEGYGLTETSPVLTCNTPEAFRPGSVGPVLPGVEVRIADDGEILTRGPNIMPGYYKRPDDTAEAFEDGWFKTGDIGHLDEDGFLYITDRKKDLLVTAGGKNVAPQPIENELKLHKFVSEAVVIGDRRRYLTVLLVPALEPLMAHAAREGLGETAAEVVAHPAIQHAFGQLVTETNERLASFEQIKKFRVVDHEFTLDDGQLTPSLKVRRRVVGEMYSEIIDSMYEE
jgi:long-chain acyl-CoA synthetase